MYLIDYTISYTSKLIIYSNPTAILGVNNTINLILFTN